MQNRCTVDQLRAAKRIHILGVCGTGMGTFAGMLAQKGFEVRGTDAGCYPPMSDLLEEWGIPVMEGYAPKNLDWNPDLVVVGNVIRRINPEATAMRERGIPHVSFPEAFAEKFLSDRHPVVITGTHGKTTTTTLTGWLLTATEQDPTLLVGGVPLNFGKSFRLGQGKHVVVEGDEYDTAYFDKVPKFVHYRPRTGIITNIEFDHADIYPDVETIEQQFRNFVSLLPADGHLLYWDGCARASRVAADAPCKAESYGSPTAFWRAENIQMNSEGTTFTLVRKGIPLTRVEAPLFGAHNLQNTVAAMAVAITEGGDPERVAEGVRRFKNIKKRHEIKGVVNGITVIDDFAHHPTAVAATVRAVRERFPNAPLYCCFEIESNTSRRRVFQDDYPPAFAAADSVVFCKPLAKADNLPPEQRIQLDRVIQGIQALGVQATLIPEVDDIVDWLVERLPSGSVVLGMSGRHFYGLHDKLLTALKGLNV